MYYRSKKIRLVTLNLTTLLITIIVLIVTVGCSVIEIPTNDNDSSVEKHNYAKRIDVNKAIEYAKSYLQEDLVGNLIGVELGYSKAVEEKISQTEYKVGFYVTEHNNLTKKDKEPKYVELYITSEKILLGYNIKSLHEYMVEAYDYSMKYTVEIYWDGTYADVESNKTDEPDNEKNSTGKLDYNITTKDSISVVGTIEKTVGFSRYCLKLDKSISIRITDDSLDGLSKRYDGCTEIYFYDDMEIIDINGMSAFLSSNDVGVKCRVVGRLEDYRDGGELFFLHPVIQVLDLGVDVNSWHSLNWALYLLNENVDIGTDRGIGIKTDKDYNTITFCAVNNNEAWDICTVDISSCKKQEIDGEKFYSFKGEMRGTYKNGEYVAGGIEVSDEISFVFNENRTELQVISLLELINGYTDYPVMCSGTYYLEE